MACFQREPKGVMLEDVQCYSFGCSVLMPGSPSARGCLMQCRKLKLVGSCLE